jgi:benzylsuccinate CoA-transferase BbsF subunit
MLGSLLLASAVTGKPPARTGSRSRAAAPQGCYRCAGDDQWCAISISSDEQWQKLCAVLGQALRHPTLADRLAHHDEIDIVIEAWTGALAPAEVERRLGALGIPAAAMRRGNELEEVAEWRGVLRALQGPGAAGRKVIGLPFAFRASAPVVATEAPRIGGGGTEALCDWLKLDAAAIDDLMREEPA